MGIFDTGTALARTAEIAFGSINQTIGNRDEVQAQAAEAKLRKNRANALNDPDLIDDEIEALKAQNESIINEGLRTKTTDAFRRFLKTGNPIHLTKLYANNKRLSEQYGGIVSIQRLDLVDDRQLLVTEGIDFKDFRPAAHLKAIMSNGTEKLFDAYGVAAGTGALNIIKAEDLEVFNAYLKAIGKDGAGQTRWAPGETEKKIDTFAEHTGRSKEEIANILLTKAQGGIEPGKQNLADAELFKMIKKTGGDEGWFNMDFSKQENRILIASEFRKYKALGGQDIDPKQQGDIIRLGKLVGLAQTVGDKLTPEGTGIYDTFLRDIRKYISDNVKEVDQVSAVSAYEAFRAMFRHALSGTALTDNEITLFNNAYGKISQQYPQVAAQFLTMLNEVKFNLETISQLNDPYISHYYLGNKMTNVNSIVTSINERIELISQDQGNEPGQFAPQTRKGVGDDLVVKPNVDPNQDPNQDPNALNFNEFTNATPEEVQKSLLEIWGN